MIDFPTIFANLFQASVNINMIIAFPMGAFTGMIWGRGLIQRTHVLHVGLLCIDMLLQYFIIVTIDNAINNVVLTCIYVFLSAVSISITGVIIVYIVKRFIPDVIYDYDGR